VSGAAVEILQPVAVGAAVVGEGVWVVVVGGGGGVAARREEVEGGRGVSPGMIAPWNVRAGRSCARFRVWGLWIRT
jgi:hypothetical protein